MVMNPVLESVALTLVFVRGTLFKSLRDSGPALWRELANCPLCIGVWIGAVWSLLQILRGPVGARAHEWLPLLLDALAAGAMTGVVALGATLVLDILDSKAAG